MGIYMEDVFATVSKKLDKGLMFQFVFELTALSTTCLCELLTEMNHVGH